MACRTVLAGCFRTAFLRRVAVNGAHLRVAAVPFSSQAPTTHSSGGHSVAHPQGPALPDKTIEEYEEEFADPLEHAAGVERKELLAKLMGETRYEPKVFVRGPGTKEEPNIIPSHFDMRLVGCVCEPEQNHINWIWVRKEEMRRCECGYWFKLIEADPESY